ncbi:MAG: class I SAM-dependent methyltransferase [Gemmataceae bacterium]
MAFQPDPNHLTKESFDKSYDGVPPWEIGRPQPEFLRLLDGGAITGSVIDVGCGTGELSLEIARRGLKVVGVDSSPKAIGRAQAKAGSQGLAVTFKVHDALQLGELHQTFDTATDCGLFHVFSDEERPKYVAGLHQILKPNGRLILMCFSDQETREGGPRRVSERELRESFAEGWTFEELRAARFEARIFPDGARNWVAIMRRI